MRMRRVAARWWHVMAGVALSGLAGCGGGGGDGGIVRPTPTPDPIVVTITPASVPNLEVGGTTQLTAAVTGGASTAARTVTWSSSADAIIRVSSSGLVTAIAPGQAVITATSDADRTKTAQLTVVANAPRITALTLNAAAATLLIGQTTTVTAAVQATGTGTNTRVRFTSSAPSVATVTTADGITGTVTAVGRGTVQITATAELDATRTATVSLTVNELRAATLDVRPTNDSVGIGGTLPLVATVRDAAGTALTGRALSWTSSNTSIATVSGAGVVTGVAPGVATITVSTPIETGSATVLTATAQLRVVSGLRLSLTPRSLQLRPTEAEPVTAAVLGGAAGIDRTVEWVSRNPAAATVSGTGVVTAVGVGTARIVARMRIDTLVRDSITVSVVEPCNFFIPHTLGTLTTRAISAASCRVNFGGAIALGETVGFSVSQPTNVVMRVQGTMANTEVLVPYVAGNFTSAPGWRYANVAATQQVRAALYLAPGSYYGEVYGRNLQTGTFQFETTLNPDPNTLCGTDRYAMQGASFTAVLGGNCSFVEVAGMTLLAVGARVSVRASATAYAVRVRIFQDNFDGTITLLASGTAAGPGASTSATFSNFGVQRNWIVYIDSPTVGAIGPAQVTIDP